MASEADDTNVKMEDAHEQQHSQAVALQEQNMDQQIMVQQLHITEEQAQLMEQQGQIVVEVQIMEQQGQIVEQQGQYVVQPSQILTQQGQTLESQGRQYILRQDDMHGQILLQQAPPEKEQAEEQLQNVEQQLHNVEQQIQAIQQCDQQNEEKQTHIIVQQQRPPPLPQELKLQLEKHPPLSIKQQLQNSPARPQRTNRRAQNFKRHAAQKKRVTQRRQQSSPKKQEQKFLISPKSTSLQSLRRIGDKLQLLKSSSKQEANGIKLLTNVSEAAGPDDVDLSQLSHSCDICSKDFSSASNLYRHVRKVHNCEVSLPTSKLLCSLCDYECSSVVGLQKHCEEKHEIRVEQEFTTFDSDEAFLCWKTNVERETKSMFVKHGGTTMREGVRYSYYRCHRSGHFKSRGQGKRSLKTRGSNKINATCPAGMKVQKVSDNCLQVEFVKTHIGHTADVDRIRLTPDERKFIAAKLVQNVLIEDILNEVHNSADGQDANRRLHLLKRHDIHNIERDFLGKYNVSPVEELRKSIKRRVDALSGFVSSCEATDQLQFIDRLLADTCSTVETIVGVFTQSSLANIKTEPGTKSRVNEENRPPPAKRSKQKKVVANQTLSVPIVNTEVQEQATATAILFLPPDVTYQMIKGGQTYDVEELILQAQE